MGYRCEGLSLTSNKDSSLPYFQGFEVSRSMQVNVRRYGSAPVDGPIGGRSVRSHWDEMISNYYKIEGWDRNGKPLPETVRNVGLKDIISDV